MKYSTLSTFGLHPSDSREVALGGTIVCAVGTIISFIALSNLNDAVVVPKFGWHLEGILRAFLTGCGVIFPLSIFAVWTWSIKRRQTISVNGDVLRVRDGFLCFHYTRDFDCAHVLKMTVTYREAPPNSFGSDNYFRVTFDYGRDRKHIFAGIDQSTATQVIETVQEQLPGY